MVLYIPKSDLKIKKVTILIDENTINSTFVNFNFIYIVFIFFKIKFKPFIKSKIVKVLNNKTAERIIFGLYFYFNIIK